MNDSFWLAKCIFTVFISGVKFKRSWVELIVKDKNTSKNFLFYNGIARREKIGLMWATKSLAL